MPRYKMCEQTLDDLRAALRDDELIDISLDDGSIYKIQRTFLRSASPWFAVALHDKFREGREKRLRFPGTETVTVELFLYWLIHRKIVDGYKRHKEQKNYILQRQAIILDLVRVWVFAEQHLLPKLKDDTMREIWAMLDNTYPSIEAIREAYIGTPTDSPLRRVMFREVDMGLRDGATSETAPNPETVASLSDLPDFIKDMAKGYAQAADGVKYQEQGLACFLIEPNEADYD